MNSAIYAGSITHTRHIPKIHSFQYPFFMWYLDLQELERGIHFKKWFSSSGFALSRYKRSDYLGDENQSLESSVRKEMEEHTGETVEGRVFGLMNVRTLGIYFSPVNFYYGFDQDENLTHFLAEVSNTPWNERHIYSHLISDKGNEPSNPKSFKVSPFNPENNQSYRWLIGAPGDELAINLGVHDERGHIFEAALRLEKKSLKLETVRGFLLRIPVMTSYIVTRIYWQALKLFVKGIPYIPYKKENT